MKIAIPTDENNVQSSVCPSFGRAPFFLIYDTQTKESEFIENTAGKSQGGAGIKAAQIIADSNVGVLITPRCGENAANVLNAADIKLYQSEPSCAMYNIHAYCEDKLSLLTEIHAGFHKHG